MGYTDIIVQVHSSHYSVINQTPYGVVFGREPKPPPKFGRKNLVKEDSHADQTDRSFATAYSDSVGHQSRTEVINTLCS